MNPIQRRDRLIGSIRRDYLDHVVVFGALTAFLYQRMRDYCIGMISSRWTAKGANVCGAGGL